MQNFVCFQLRRKLKNSHMVDDACKVNRRFDAGVAAADDGDVFAFKQWSVTVRAVCDTFVFELLFAGYADIAPACAS